MKRNTLKILLKIVFFSQFHHQQSDLPLKTMADVAPITPKKGEYMGLCSAVAILNLCVLSEKNGSSYNLAEMREKGGCHMSAAARNHPWTSVTRLGTGAGGVWEATTRDSWLTHMTQHVSVTRTTTVVQCRDFSAPSKYIQRETTRCRSQQ